MKVTQLCLTLHPHGLYSPWNSPGQNTGVGSFSLLQGIFPTQGSNRGLLHCRRILYQLSHKGSPVIWLFLFYYPPPHSFSLSHSCLFAVTWPFLKCSCLRAFAPVLFFCLGGFFPGIMKLLPHFIMACVQIVPPREAFIGHLIWNSEPIHSNPYPVLVFTVSLSDIVVSISLSLVCVPPEGRNFCLFCPLLEITVPLLACPRHSVNI